MSGYQHYTVYLHKVQSWAVFVNRLTGHDSHRGSVDDFHSPKARWQHNECRCHPVNHSNKCSPVKVIINTALTILFDGVISDFTELTKSQSV